MTEPNTGSDVASMKTHAIDKGDHWEVHGNKMWISQAHVGDAGLLYAYTDRQGQQGHDGLHHRAEEDERLHRARRSRPSSA